MIGRQRKKTIEKEIEKMERNKYAGIVMTTDIGIEKKLIKLKEAGKVGHPRERFEEENKICRTKN